MDEHAHRMAVADVVEWFFATRAMMPDPKRVEAWVDVLEDLSLEAVQAGAAWVARNHTGLVTAALVREAALRSTTKAEAPAQPDPPKMGPSPQEAAHGRRMLSAAAWMLRNGYASALHDARVSENAGLLEVAREHGWPGVEDAPATVGDVAAALAGKIGPG